MEYKKIIEAVGSDTPVIAKIEKLSAVESIASIAEHADGLMVARGDLGVECSVEKVPVFQRTIIAEAARKAEERAKIDAIKAEAKRTEEYTIPDPNILREYIQRLIRGNNITISKSLDAKILTYNGVSFTKIKQTKNEKINKIIGDREIKNYQLLETLIYNYDIIIKQKPEIEENLNTAIDEDLELLRKLYNDIDDIIPEKNYSFKLYILLKYNFNAINLKNIYPEITKKNF